MKISFTGHAFIPSSSRVKEIVKEQIRANIPNAEVITCYLGGRGGFDEICALACRELKQEYANIQLVYVSPYISISEQARIKEMQSYGVYDTSIYPPIENVPPKFAIIKRNEWMMTNADLIIAYVDHNYGGAYQSLRTAKCKNKNIINICDLPS